MDLRLRVLLEVARRHGTTLPLEDLTKLFSESGPAGAADLTEWLRAHPAVGEVTDGHVVPPGGSAPNPERLAERRARGETYWNAAGQLVEGPLDLAARFVQCVGVTGSAAYREPVEGDDVDLMAVTRPGTLWLFLALAFTRMRWGGRSTLPERSHWCLNYVIDATRIRSEYLRPQGFLFAREALTARMVLGASYYRDLLSRADWMANELPRLYRAAIGTAIDPPPPETRAGAVTRLLNLMAFPLLAAYLQARGLVQNRRLEREGRSEERFRTETRLERFALHTSKYARLQAVYSSLGHSAPSQAPA